MKKVRLFMLVGALFFSFNAMIPQEANAGWFEKSTIKAMYAKPVVGGIGIIYKGITIGLNLSRGYLYTIVACEGVALNCSYTIPVVINPENLLK
jgi:hypothetical protein